jgi:hypothetical protein
MQYAEWPSMMAYKIPPVWVLLNSLITPWSLVDAYQNEIFALELAANAVVPLAKSEVISVTTARSPAVNRLNFSFILFFPPNFDTKKEPV